MSMAQSRESIGYIFVSINIVTDFSANDLLNDFAVMYNISDNFDVKHGALTIDTTLVITSTGSVFIYFKINIVHYNTRSLNRGL